MPFGKYVGVPLDEVPKDYIKWLLCQDWFVDPKGRWAQLHLYFTQGSTVTASEKEIKESNLEDELLLPMDTDFQKWWHKNYGRRLRDAKSDYLIPYLRIAIAAYSFALAFDAPTDVSPMEDEPHD